MSWSNITQVVSVLSLPASTNTDLDSDAIQPVRITDETGIAQMCFVTSAGGGSFKDPGTTTGTFYIQGKLHEDAPWSDVYVNGTRKEVDAADVSAGVGLFTSVAITNVPMLPSIRVHGEDINPTASNVFLDVFIME